MTGSKPNAMFMVMSDAAKKALHELVDRLPASKVSKVRRVLEDELSGDTGAPRDELSALQKAEALGLVGCLDGDAPIDLASNPAHMAGFGR